MYSAFNSNFEISLRLLILMSHTMQSMDLEEIYILDFVATYAQAFSVYEKSINGENQFMYSEFASRRELVRRGLRELVKMGLVELNQSKNGFEYIITAEGVEVADALDSDYSIQYKNSIVSAYKYIGDKTTEEMLDMINSMSLSSVRNGEGI